MNSLQLQSISEGKEVDFGVCAECGDDLVLKEFVVPNRHVILWLECRCWRECYKTEEVGVIDNERKEPKRLWQDTLL